MTERRRLLEDVRAGRVSPTAARERLAALAAPAPGGADRPMINGPAASDAIAIVGSSSRFAGADTAAELWSLVAEAGNAVGEVPASRWDAAARFSTEPGPGRVTSRWGGFLTSVDQFDPLFFNISGREAEAMDPQQRLFLDVAWTALEESGYAGSDRLPRRCGVYVGAPPSDYLTADEREGAGADARTMIGNDSSILAARISYLLDLRGPNLSLNTACSSSLVALDLAVRSLQSGQTDLAVVGGVCLFLGPGFYLSASAGGMLSPTGACRAFDAEADGFVPGEGVGALVLRRLSDALEAGDEIHGVVLATGTNQDGRTNGLTAPSARAQHELIREVRERAGVAARDIELVEAHGTGTALGDPIEIDALTRAFREDTDERQFCAVGSVKTNIGHTGQAAGLAGIVKVLGAFRNHVIPPTRNFTAPNPAIPFDESPFYVPTVSRPWLDRGRPRRAAVSSFGYSGTNAHAILEEPPARPARPVAPSRHVVVLSARTQEALDALRLTTAQALRGAADGVTLHDVAFTLARGRRRWPVRWACAVDDLDALVACLESGRESDDPAARRFVEDGTDPASHDDCPGVIVRLPTHPRDQQRYWHSEPEREDAPRMASDAGLILRDVPFDDGGRTFDLDVSGSWVTDHRVGSSLVMAAAGTITVIVAAARAVGVSGRLRLDDLRWSAPTDPARPLSVHVHATGADWKAELLEDGDAAPRVRGRVSRDHGQTPESPAPAPDGHPIDPDVLYDRLGTDGLVHGPAYRLLSDVAAGPGWARASYSVPVGTPNADALILDAALQVTAVQAMDAGRQMGVPVSLGTATLPAGGLPLAGWVHATAGTRGTADVVIGTGDVVVATLTLLRTSASPARAPGAGLLERRWRPARSAAFAPDATVVLGGDGSAWTPAGEPVSEVHTLVNGGELTALVDADARSAPDAVRPLLEAALAHPASVHLTLVVRRGPTGESTALGLAALVASLGQETAGVTLSVSLTPWGAAPGAGAGAGPFLTQEGAVQELALEPLARTGAWVPGAGYYLVSGGTGYVGRAVARAIADAGGRPVLLGRTPPPDPITDEHGDELPFVRVDVSDPADVDEALSTLRPSGPISGVVHVAGAAHGSAWRTDDPAAVGRLVSTKLGGAQILDEATRGDDLDLFCVMSSILALTGLPGHSAYGYANGAVDGLMLERARTGRRGRSLSIAWGPWDGGMADGVRPSGAPQPFDSITGGQAFLDVLASAATCVVAVADPADARQLALLTAGTTASSTVVSQPEQPVVDAGEGGLADLDIVRRLVSDELHVPAERIGADSLLTDLGVESFMVVDLARRLEEFYEDVPKTVFFECRTIGALAAALGPRRRAPQASPEPVDTVRTRTSAPVATHDRVDAERPRVVDESTDDIAIIGLAGRYPEADDLDEYWANLRGGKDCVLEIPEERWPLDGFFEPERAPLRSYSKWGGFLRDIDRFDPAFFRIAPKEAAMIDPQERLVLQAAWHAVESAALTPASLPRDTGVFVGVMYGEHQLLGAHPDGRLAGSSFASIANRVSFTFDIDGPSMAVDTMCSSSLTAVHLAISAIRRGECAAAIVGGVNLNLHPRKYLQLSLARFASTDGRCRSFGAGGDGYVPGEGVGVVVLKALPDALRDGDPIRAVLRGSAVNHGGRANGYTVPDPVAQGRVVLSALKDSGTDAGGIGYVEGHGTGTALGDPIEVRGLATVFAGQRGVPLGSVKSNIGHLESAAGVAALTKAVLQLEHEVLVPSLHAHPLNEDLHLDEAGLAIVTHVRPWPEDRPRVALVNSFGAGGSNASIVVAAAPDPAPRAGVSADQHLIVVSADEPEQLRAHAFVLAEWMERQAVVATDLFTAVRHGLGSLLGVTGDEVPEDAPWDELGLDPQGRSELDRIAAPWFDTRGLPASVRSLADVRACSQSSTGHAPRLADVARTLQDGRVHHRERFALLASTWEEAVLRLRALADGGDPPQTWRGRTGSAVPAARDETANTHDGLAGRWVSGHDVIWPDVGGRRVPLPGYPFRPDRTWLDGTEPFVVPGAAGRPPAAVAAPAASPPTAVRQVQVRPDENSGHQDALVEILRRIAGEIVGLDPERLDPERPFGDAGFESMTLRDLGTEVGTRLGVEINPALFYEVDGVAGLAERLLQDFPAQTRDAVGASQALAEPRGDAGVAATSTVTLNDRVANHAARATIPESTGVGSDAIAVVGLSIRLPGSEHYEDLWDHLERGDRLLSEVPTHRWDWRSFGTRDAGVGRWGGFIDGEDAFDPEFFGIEESEARLIDPQQRLLLEHAWSALEDAGIAPSSLRGSATGVFAGVQFRDYQHLLHEAGVLDIRTATGNEDSFAVNRISYLLDLRGPSEVLNTACASSLSAVHRGVRSLRSGECTVALVGGVALNLTPYAALALDGVGVLAKDGRCRPLDAAASGYVKGEGVGFLVLKPLQAALADRDHVHAVIRGSATNHGGRATSMTAPNMRAQADVVAAAVRDARVDIDTIGYVEMHGTGTYVGDPVEVRGLRMAISRLSQEQGVTPETVRIGSGKGNYGHLEPASGLAGLVKVIGSLQRGRLFGMPELEEVNPHIDLTGSPFVIVDKTSAWPSTLDVPRRCGVSSFGIGGSNAHVVVEEAPDTTAPDTASPRALAFPLSARTPSALIELSRRLLSWVDAQDPDRRTLVRVARTLQQGRDHHSHRLLLVASEWDELRDGLRLAGAGGLQGVVALDGDAASDAQAWVEGRAAHISQGLDVVSVPLPTYPFERRRLWFAERSPLSGGERDDAATTVAPSPQDATQAPLRPPAASPEADGAEVARIRHVVAGVLAIDPDAVPTDVPFRELGVDSLLSISVMEALHAQVDSTLPLSALTDHPTIEHLAASLHGGGGQQPQRTGSTTPVTPSARPAAVGRGAKAANLVRLTSGEPQLPGSFWVPGAVGFAMALGQLAHEVGGAHRFHAFQARGADGSSMPQMWPEMLDDYLAAILDAQAEGPYFLGGHSFGGLVAMQLARRLADLGHEITHLVMVDTYPPTETVFSSHDSSYDDAFMAFYLANVLVDVEHHPDRRITRDDLKGTPDEVRLVVLSQLVAERVGGLTTADDAYRYLRGGLVMSEHSAGLYQQATLEPYGCSDVTFFRATDGFVGASSASYWEPVDILGDYDYVKVWRETVTTRFEEIALPEDHLHLLDGDCARTVAARVRQILADGS